MKKYLMMLLCAVLSQMAVAQSGRLVNGVVFDENDSPISGVKVVAKGGTESCVTGQDGRFKMTISPYVQSLDAYAEGYLTQSAEIDGSSVVFRLKVDKKYAAQKAAAQKAAAATAAAEAAAKVKAEKTARRNELDKEYNSKYKNKGLVHSVELSYGYQLVGKKYVVYKNLGYRNYRSFHPIEATYTIGYRFCNWASVGVGAGVSYNLVNLCTYGDVFDPMYRDVDLYTPINIPVFLNAKIYMSRGKCQPMLSLSGGVYAPNLDLLADAGIGCNLRLSKKANMYFLASIRTTPYGKFMKFSFEEGAYLPYFVLTPSFKFGFTF